MPQFVRSTWLPISRWANANKLEQLRSVHREYVCVMRETLDVLWLRPVVGPRPRYTEIGIKTHLSSNLVRNATCDAAAIVVGTRRSAKRLKRPAAKPVIKDDHPMQLGEEFVKITASDEAKHFDAWIRFAALYKRGHDAERRAVSVPVNFNRHVTKLRNKGELRQYVIFDGHRVGLVFRCEAKPREAGAMIGIDVGIADVVTASDGQHGRQHSHGWSLSQIQQRLARRRKGSRGFRRAQDLRTNFINWSVNQLNLDNVSTLVVEDIKHLRRGRPCDRFQSHWTYAKILNKLNMLAEEHGVRVIKVNPAYTSQKCSNCGKIDRDSRKAKHFRCTQCGFECDADMNAATNLRFVGEALAVPRVGENERQELS